MRALMARWWRRSPAGTVALLILWLFASTIATLAAIELALQARATILHAFDRSEETRLANGYEPFLVEHLHPTLLFGPPRSDALRAANNPVCSMDEAGFRNPGVGASRRRPLAFLLGGSVAFGLLASSDDTTITSYMNRLQDRYYFVNAGFPGLNSTQELVRLTADLANYHPALVVALNGWNDATLAEDRRMIQEDLPPGVPEQYPLLVDILTADAPSRRGLRPEVLLPQLWNRWHRWRADSAATLAPVEDEKIGAAAQRYIANIRRARIVATAIGARYVAVFQPHASLHRGASADLTSDPVIRFHRAVDALPMPGVEFFDFGDVFDRLQDPVSAGAMSRHTYFADAGHLHDAGNLVVARELLTVMGIPLQP
jgi:hypothetical protein